MDIYKKFTRDVVLVGITQTVVRLRGLILLPILAKTLGASGYGIWSLAMVTIYFLAPIAGLGLNQAMVRFLAGERDREKIREGFCSIILLISVSAGMVGVFLYISSGFLATEFFSDAKSVQIIQIASAILILWVLDNTFLTYFRTFRQMEKYSFSFMGATIVEVLLITIMVFSGHGLLGAVNALLISRLIFFIVLLGVISNEISFKIPRFTYIKKYLRFSIPLIPVGIFGWVIDAADRYIIGFYLTSAAVGIYSASYNIGAVITAFMSPIGFVLYPALSKLWEEGKTRELENHLKYSLKYFLMLSIPSFFGLSMLSKQILRILARPDFVSEGYMVIPIIAFSMLFYSATCTLNYWIFALVKKTERIFLIYFLCGIMNIALNIVLIPEWGILGAAIATLISFMAAGLLTIYLTRDYVRYQIDYISSLKSILASLIMAAVITVVNPLTMLSVSFWIISGAIIYFISFTFFGGFEEKEKQFFKGILKSVIIRIGLKPPRA